MDLEKFIRLCGGIRHYAWGERAAEGVSPYIAELLGKPAGEEPWAELWLGAHPSLPGRLVLPDGGMLTLAEAIAAQPEAWLGRAAAQATTPPQLSFLFKVLACSHPLSIQSHPDATTARELHATKPELYPDANDKTEIMIALRPFEALAGFRNPAIVQEELAAIAAFAELARKWKADAPGNLKGLCQAIFDLPENVRQTMLAAAQTQIAAVGPRNPAETLFLKLSAEYPGDRGLFFAFLLNQVTLQPRQALFLPPNTPHAYQQGAGIECMTNSDNVIRAGLTPKAVDVETLMGTLNFGTGGAQLLQPECELRGQGSVAKYRIPTPKFQLAFYQDATCQVAELGDRFALFLVVSGSAELAAKGQTVQTAAKGISFVRPAALAEATITPQEPGTLVVCATPNF